MRVVLSGDGGDEVFGGYPKYRVDAVLRRGGRVAELGLRAGPPSTSTGRTHRQLDRALGDDVDPRAASPLGVVVSDDGVDGRRSRSWHPGLSDGPVVERLASRLAEAAEPYAAVDDGRRMLLADLFTYLPDNMLLRSDKVLMAGSLEGRMPLVDVEVVSRASAAPAGARASLRQPKRILREATESLVPSELVGGPKKGFPVPIERFLVEDGRQARRAAAAVGPLPRAEASSDRTRFVRPFVARPSSRTSSALFVLTSFELWARANLDQVTTQPPPARSSWTGCSGGDDTVAA